ncbi:MAG: S1 RNA-binding domain-containing protein, partial [Chloroflexi bacterium]|nr:S1 RNA-binding domain-containing protein [Chloroflexota bacterium]
AMGLVTNEDGRYAILTDIQGMEDQLGDMDFKVAGTRAGITALQMDIKIKGLTFEQLQQALTQAREARLKILDIMSATIDAPRTELSPYAPCIIRLVIPVEKIGALIGPGGRNIRRIQEETGTKLEVEDDGTVFVCARDTESGQQALLLAERFTKDVEINGVYLGKVSRLTNFGAFVEILPGKEGLIRMSELAEYDVQRPEDVVAVGDEIMVMVIEIDSQGRVNLSRRAVLQGAAYRPAPRPPMRSPAGAGTRRPFSSSGEPRSSSPRSSTLGERRPPSYRRPQNRDDFRPPFEPRP